MVGVLWGLESENEGERKEEKIKEEEEGKTRRPEEWMVPTEFVPFCLY